MYDDIEYYQQEVRQTALLTAEEEYDLLLRCAQGDQEARGIIIQCNQRLVLREVRKACRKNESLNMHFMDLIQEGNLGMLRALELFDISTGYRFSTYAGMWIFSYVKRAIRDVQYPVRLPKNDDSEAARAGLAFWQQSRCLPLDALAFDDNDATIGDYIPDMNDDYADIGTQEMVQQLLASLTPQLRALIDARYGISSGESVTERNAGIAIGVSLPTAHKYIQKAFDIMRQSDVAQELLSA